MTKAKFGHDLAAKFLAGCTTCWLTPGKVAGQESTFALRESVITRKSTDLLVLRRLDGLGLNSGLHKPCYPSRSYYYWPELRALVLANREYHVSSFQQTIRWRPPLSLKCCGPGVRFGATTECLLVDDKQRLAKIKQPQHSLTVIRTLRPFLRRHRIDLP